MDLYVEIRELCQLLKWRQEDFSVVQRCFRPPLGKTIAPSTTGGRGPSVVELDATLRWLDGALPGGLPHPIARQIADRAKPLL